LKTVSTEDLIEGYSAVVHFAIVNMQEETAMRLEDAMSLLKTGRQERHEVIEYVIPTPNPQVNGSVSLALVANPVASIFIVDDLHPPPLLPSPSVEGRVDVNQVYGSFGHGTKYIKVVAKVDSVGHCCLHRLASLHARLGPC
jgi:hypothetical protein